MPAGSLSLAAAQAARDAKMKRKQRRVLADGSAGGVGAGAGAGTTIDLTQPIATSDLPSNVRRGQQRAGILVICIVFMFN